MEIRKIAQIKSFIQSIEQIMTLNSPYSITEQKVNFKDENPKRSKTPELKVIFIVCKVFNLISLYNLQKMSDAGL